jgi:hypothetical protein
MVRRDVFDKAGGTFDDSSGKIGSDWELFARVCQLCKVDYIPESLIKVYVHHGHARLSTDFYNEQAKKDIMFHEKFLKNFQDNFIRHPEFRRIHYYIMCLGYATLGDKQTAWQYYSRMLRCKPSLKCLLRPLIKLFINK